jgi:Bacteriophage Lambda NinG protein
MAGEMIRTPATFKSRPCCECQTVYTPSRRMQPYCSPSCGVALAKKKVARKSDRAEKAARRDEVRQTRAQKEALKTLPKLIKEAQAAFNKFIRFRDISDGRGCISCGKRYDASEQVPGGGWDAGHYRSVGSAYHMRFEEMNVHLQCKRCNDRKSGNAVDYRIRLIKRAGIDAVEALEADQTTRNWTRDDVRQIRDEYRAKARELEKRMRVM